MFAVGRTAAVPAGEDGAALLVTLHSRLDGFFQILLQWKEFRTVLH